ncbi:Hint domain-containing protein [Oceaniglobus indicus]|uniref:Hint domain-containing protein n=1 Tax=Oceaniglobus indicus TaxID=2047749 RepID=UPI000C1837D3|nr:Hint domain-containing protein [Oceaniglobus indicus]
MASETYMQAFPFDSTSSPGNETGFSSGTRILTLRGEIAIDKLRPGDRIVTRDAGARPLKALHRRLRHGVRPCRIGTCALGNMRPARAIILGADQPILLRDWRAHVLFGHRTAMVAVKRIADGTFIRRTATARTLEMFLPDLGENHVVYIEGLEFGTSPVAVRTLEKSDGGRP